MGTPVALPPQSNREGERQKASPSPTLGRLSPSRLRVNYGLQAARWRQLRSKQQPSALRTEVSQRSDALKTANP